MASNRLNLWLRVNAVYSGVSGALAVVVSGRLAEALGLPTEAVVALGAGLIGYAGVVGWLSTGGRATARVGLIVAAADAAWALSVALFLVVSRPAAAGTVIAMASTIPVAVLAVLQARAAARLTQPGVRVVEVTRTVEGDPADVWEVMTDPEVYARLSPNLSKVGAFVSPAVGGQRRCWDIRDKHWDETLTVWRPGESFSVEVHTDASDYPYPMALMQGSWSVADAGSRRSRVTMRFTFTPEASVAGQAFATALARTGPTMMRRIITGWAGEVAARQEA